MRALPQKGLEAFAVHPGVIQTRLGRHMTEEDIAYVLGQNRPKPDEKQPKPASRPSSGSSSGGGIKTVEQGAATSCYAATAPELAGKGGAYLENCGIAEPVPDDSDVRYGIRGFASDPQAAEKLWTVSEDMVGRRFGA